MDPEVPGEGGCHFPLCGCLHPIAGCCDSSCACYEGEFWCKNRPGGEELRTTESGVQVVFQAQQALVAGVTSAEQLEIVAQAARYLVAESRRIAKELGIARTSTVSANEKGQ
jgi:hypothetical protein